MKYIDNKGHKIEYDSKRFSILKKCNICNSNKVFINTLTKSNIKFKNIVFKEEKIINLIDKPNIKKFYKYENNKIVRKYVYETLYDEVINWAKKNNINTPNNKNNFPFFLQEYINYLKNY